jgi:orotidine-5'-phosphate decarboxylase
MNFADRLVAAVGATRSPCVLGLDPHPGLLPEAFAIARDTSAPRARRALAMGDFLCALIDIARGRVPAVKPQSAFFELLGPDGAQAWERVVAHAHAADLLVIGDVKRGDIASTARAYAEAYLCESSGAPPQALCDAVTLNPYLGFDSIEPFLEVCRETGRGLFILVRTSNPGSADFQLHGVPTLSELVAKRVHEWGETLVGASGLSSVGAVVGATHPTVLRTMRELMPRAPFLLPGYGAQGAGAAETRDAFLPGARGALVSSSRGVAFAWRDAPRKSWERAASDALEAMVADLRAALVL